MSAHEMTNQRIYLDNAATTYPKPRTVLDRMMDRYHRMGVSPGRASHDLAAEAEQYLGSVRKKVAAFFGAADPERVVFASNATDALNAAIQGILKPGDHAVATRLEHNSVLRPLHHLKRALGIEHTLVGFDQNGIVSPDAVRAAIRSTTRLVIVNHASNVLGTIQPIAEIGKVCAEMGVPLLVDTAQSAGYVSFSMVDCNVSAVAFTGHKALLGPSGIGGLVVARDLEIATTRFGGTGVDSRNLTHTQDYPYRLEAGTHNMLGIMGLSEGLDYLEHEGMGNIYRRELALTLRLRAGLGALENVTLYTPRACDRLVPIVTCGVRGIHPDDVGAILDGDYGIAVRTGLHCAPLVHADLGTSAQGAVRFSLGCNNTEADVNLALEAMAEISRKARR